MRNLTAIGILAGAAFASILLPAQVAPPKPAGPGSNTGSGNNSPGTMTPGNTSPNRGTIPGNTPNPDGLNRGAFFYGKVAMTDGTAPPPQVVIERVCGGSVRPQAYADTKGNFSFQVGQTQDVFADATVGRSSQGTVPGMGPNQNSNQSNAGNFGCDLRASLPGYRSDLVSLAGRRNLDDPNVGTIFLHRLANVEGLTTSATSSLAPKDARKAFDKGLDAVKKSKVDEAQADFLKATELYPRYASAWFELGRVYEQREHIAEARDAYAKSIEADSKFVNPYERLYKLAIKEQNWEDVGAVTLRIMRLNPYDFPEAVYYNALANLQLGKLDAAEKSAREAASMESAARNPKINYVLGTILARKQDYKGAAECLRAYLKSDATGDRDRVTKMLAEIEKELQANAEGKPDK